MSFKTNLSVVILLMFIAPPLAHAGKVELTTYYPAPTGEYAALHAANKLKIPEKHVLPGSAEEAALTKGEIWLDPNPS